MQTILQSNLQSKAWQPNPGKGETTFNGVLLLVVWCIFTPYFIFTFILFIRRWDKQPIKARSPLLLSISSVAGYIMITHYCWMTWYSEENWPCIVSHWLIWAVMSWYYVPYILRCLRLFFIFKINFEKTEMHKGKDGEKKKQGFFVRKRHWFTDRRLLIWLIIFNTLVFLFGLFRQFYYSDNYPGRYGCTVTTLYLTGMTVIFVFFLTFFLISIWFLRKVRDEFNINNELKAVSLTWTLLIIPYIIIQWVGYNEDIFTTTYFQVLWPLVSYIISDVYPLHLSYISSQIITFSTSNVLSSLKTIIGNERACKHFEEFLVGEFSVENLLFYQDVARFKLLTDSDEINSQGKVIFDKYIDPSSVLEVNIDSNEKQQITKEIVNPYTGIFDKSQESIFMLMERDSYPRFLKSAICTKFKKELQNEENVLQILKKQKMV
eukprot:Anaeramoba_ignava/a92053_26.p1 GENE.a92053_26~~a92053_26.p1  ORF type:complete len:434 (+),score=71.77 a92053_26:6-1307(+)